MGKASIVYDKGIADYDFGLEYEVRGDRFPRYLNLLESKELFGEDIDLVKPEPATDEDLLLVHSQEYIRRVKRLAEENGYLAEDTQLNWKIVNATRLIVGAALKAGELVADGKVRIAQGVGGGLHHAGRDYGDGFCVFNDVAVCAKALLERHGYERVMIFDTDAHAANGTMDIFYDEPRVLQLSVHQDPKTLFPYTGFIEQIGQGKGKGYKVNVPLPPGADDSCMLLVIDDVFRPLVEQYNPDVMIRVGGADPLHDDDYADLSLTYDGLRMIGTAAAEAALHVGCGLIDLVCSGYNPGTEEIGLYAILSGELGLEFDYIDSKAPEDHSDLVKSTRDAITRLSSTLKDFWKI
jgi:acetoin utilization protein AcuC